MGHSLRGTNLTISGSFSIYDGNEAANYILISGTSGQANWAKPSSYVSSNPDKHYIGELFGGGVVVAVWKESGIEKCLIAGPENLSTTGTSAYDFTYFKYGLSFSGVALTEPALNTYGSFGASNSVVIAANTPGSAAKMCLDYVNPNLGTGIWNDWFLPSISELRHLINNSAIFNKVMERYAADNFKPIEDEIKIYVFGGDGRAIWAVNPTDINLVKFGTFTKYRETIVTNTGSFVSSALANSNDLNNYLSSTCIGVQNPISISMASEADSGFMNAIPTSYSRLARVRPFRIADDTQKSIVFDADYAIITYTFTGGNDLDTRTRMISPSQSAGVTPFEQSSSSTYTSGSNNFSSNWIGYASRRPWYTGPQYLGGSVMAGTLISQSYDYTPGLTTSVPAPAGYYNAPGINTGNNQAGTYSILWHSGDNTGSGKESVVVNLNAFKHHFPGQSEIEIDCRAWFYSSNNTTRECTLDIVLYKGGTISRKSYSYTDLSGNLNPDYFIWQNTGYSASYSVTSYPVSVPGWLTPGSGAVSGSAGWQYATIFGKFKYNVVGKFGFI
jgi:hypothetical protein